MIDCICTSKDLYGKSLSPETLGSVGIDLRASVSVALEPGEAKMVSSGIRLDMTSKPRLFGLVFPRSSTGAKGLCLANTVGVIDNDYQGEIVMPLLYRGDQEMFVVERGTRVAQLVFMYSAMPANTCLNQVDDFQSKSERGSNGLGSTGES